MNQLTVTLDTFTSMLSGLIQSGVTFTAEEHTNTPNYIIITFTGGY